MSRIENSWKNVSWKTVVTITNGGLSLANRFIFMYLLGAEFAGLNGLFNSVLGVLSFADIGFSQAFSYCFYKPVAEKDQEHIRTLLYSLRKVINIVIVVIVATGLMVVPFLRFFVKGGESIDDIHLQIYYMLALLETVLSYVSVYRICYVSAMQKEYIITPILVLFKTIFTITRLAVLVVFHNYIFYLVSGILVLLFQQIFVNIYVRKKFPETSKLKKSRLPEADRKSVLKNLKGLLLGKLGFVAVNQTDNIIISAGMGIKSTGIMTNYVSIKDIALQFIGTVSTALTASMGDLMVKENNQKQLEVFYTFLTMNSCCLGVLCCSLSLLSTAFITLLFGIENSVEQSAVILMYIAAYFAYSTNGLNLLTTAGGKYYIGAKLGVMGAIVNLVVSVFAMKQFGLCGIYMGTVAAEFLIYFIKPFMVFQEMYKISPAKFFLITGKGLLTAGLGYCICWQVNKMILNNGITIFKLLIAGMETLGILTTTYFVGWRKEIFFKKAVMTGKDYIFTKVKNRKE